jgi:hypothetical protein
VTRDEADANLAQAIRHHAAAYDMADNNEMLNDYAIIANWQTVTDTGESIYTVHYHRDDVPTHVAGHPPHHVIGPYDETFIWPYW